MRLVNRLTAFFILFILGLYKRIKNVFITFICGQAFICIYLGNKTY